jgi:hypothetical protein
LGRTLLYSNFYITLAYLRPLSNECKVEPAPVSGLYLTVYQRFLSRDSKKNVF